MEATGKMNNSLLKIYNSIKDELSKLTRSDLIGRHKLGAKFHEVLTDTAKYGDGACNSLAEALNVKPNYIYTHARVASTWSFEEIDDISKNKPCVSFSHLVHIAKVPDPKKRQAIVDAVQSYDLAVDATVTKVSEVLKSAKPSAPSDDKKSPFSATKKMLKLVTAVTGAQEEFESCVFDPVTDTPAEYADGELIGKLCELSDKLEELDGIIRGNKLKLKACIAACEKASEAGPEDGGDFDTDGDDMPIPTSNEAEYDDEEDLSTVLSAIGKKGR